MHNRHQKNDYPRVLKRTATTDGIQLLLDIAAELNCFAGHFPGQPITPGVAQVDWAMHFSAELGFDPQKFTGIPRLKFQSLMEPENSVQLELSRVDSRLRFRFSGNDVLYSQGVIEFSR